MKKFLLISLLTVASVAMAQKAQYVSIKGQFGQSTLLYDLEQGERTSGLGFGGELNYRFYFNKHWGFGLGVGYNSSLTEAEFGNVEIDNGNFYDFDVLILPVDGSNIYPNSRTAQGDPYTSMLYLKQWKETQKVNFLNVPLVISFQQTLSKKSGTQMYIDAGARLFLPMSSSYEVNQGVFENAGYYYAPGYGFMMNNVPQRYDQVNDWRPSGEMDLTYGIAATASLGFIFPLSDKLDLTAGVSVDYGLTDIKNDESSVVTLDADAKMRGYEDYLLGNIASPTSVDPEYVGMVNSSSASAVGPLRLGVEIGLRFCIAKEEIIIPPTPDTVVVFKQVRDTITVVDTVVVSDTIITQDVEDAMNRMRQESEGLKVLTKDEKGDGSLYGMTDKELEVLQFALENYPMAQTNLTDDQVLLLEKKCDILKKYEHLQIKIVGHTCNTGTSSINMQVGQERAEKTKDAFVERGIDSDRIIVASYGELKPRYPNDSEKAKSLNRRVTIEPKVK